MTLDRRGHCTDCPPCADSHPFPEHCPRHIASRPVRPLPWPHTQIEASARADALDAIRDVVLGLPLMEAHYYALEDQTVKRADVLAAIAVLSGRADPRPAPGVAMREALEGLRAENDARSREDDPERIDPWNKGYHSAITDALALTLDPRPAPETACIECGDTHGPGDVDYCPGCGSHANHDWSHRNG